MYHRAARSRPRAFGSCRERVLHRRRLDVAADDALSSVQARTVPLPARPCPPAPRTMSESGSFSSDRHAPDALGMSASLRSLPKFGTAANRRGVPFAVIREAIRALNSQEHPAASNDIATGRAGKLLFWKLVRENSELVDLRRF